MSRAAARYKQQDWETQRRHGVATGTFFTVLGLLGIVLLLISPLSDLPGSLHQLIRSNPAFWLTGSLGFLAFGVFQHRRYEGAAMFWNPKSSGKRFQSLTVYTREHCPLCDEAVDLLRRYQRWLPPIEEIDIETSEDLIQKYGESIPVVCFDGKRRFWGNVSEPLLRRLIEGTSPVPVLRRR